MADEEYSIEAIQNSIADLNQKISDHDQSISDLKSLQPDLSKTQEDVQTLDESVSSEIDNLKSYDSELEDLLNGPSGVSYAQVKEYIEQAQSFDLQDFDT